jgi:ABC transporter substrate binding protein (PQQ-dependent alcohol dehydrogenase system)
MDANQGATTPDLSFLLADFRCRCEKAAASLKAGMMVRADRFLPWMNLRLIATAALSLFFFVPAAFVPVGRAAEPVEIRIAYLSRQPPPPPLYEIDPVPEDEGLAGGQLGIRDNNTTGTFTGHRYVLQEAWLEDGEDPVAKAKALAADRIGFIALNLPADEMVAVADALKGEDVVLFNVGAADDRLRAESCRVNVLHVAPSHAMMTDALAQFLAFKRWRKIMLVVGPQPADKLYADAMRRAARKFGLIVSAEKPWEFGPLARAKGDSPTTADALVFTRGVDYDVAVVADVAGDFGDYLAYRTWDPRLIAGTQGLVPTSWHPTLEVWGAAQAQTRFRRTNNRLMRPLDYQLWMAVRAIGDAVTQTKQTGAAAVKARLLNPAFGLPAYKGVPLSFRPWDQQLRQPLLIVQPKALVSVAPERGFLHQRTPLDTLGIDEPETACKFS